MQAADDRCGLHRIVWSVGTNLLTQVGADWALPSCQKGYHIHATSSSSRTRGVGSPRVLTETTGPAESSIGYHRHAAEAKAEKEVRSSSLSNVIV